MNIYEAFFSDMHLFPFSDHIWSWNVTKIPANTFNLVSTVTYFVTIKLMLQKQEKTLSYWKSIQKFAAYSQIAFSSNIDLKIWRLHLPSPSLLKTEFARWRSQAKLCQIVQSSPALLLHCMLYNRLSKFARSSGSHSYRF